MAVGLVVVALVTAALLTGVPTAPSSASAPSSGTWRLATAPGNAWSNGQINFDLYNSSPIFSVALASNQSRAAEQALTGLAEVDPNDTIRSFASFSSPLVAWTISAGPDSFGMLIQLMASVPVVASGGEWESHGETSLDSTDIGRANVTISFQLNVSSAPDPWSVSYTLSVTNWPWLNLSDSVGVEVSANATSPTVYWVTTGPNQLTELSKPSQQPVAAFLWGSVAQAHYSGGESQNSSVGTYQNLSANGSSYLVRLEFGAVTGGYASLSYDPWLAVVPSGSVSARLAAWVVTPAGLEVLGGGAGLAIALAVVARWRRRPPEEGL